MGSIDDLRYTDMSVRAHCRTRPPHASVVAAPASTFIFAPYGKLIPRNTAYCQTPSMAVALTIIIDNSYSVTTQRINLTSLIWNIRCLPVSEEWFVTESGLSRVAAILVVSLKVNVDCFGGALKLSVGGHYERRLPGILRVP